VRRIVFSTGFTAQETATLTEPSADEDDGEDGENDPTNHYGVE